MTMELKLPDMGEHCRLCLADHGSMTSLQDERVEAKLKDLTKCTSIDIKHQENLPNVVCHICLYKLDLWSEFKERFMQSNKILLKQLELSEISDNTTKNSSKNEKDWVESGKRKHINETGEDSTSEKEKKKTRLEISSLEPASIDSITDETTSKTICISGDDEIGSSKDSHKTLSGFDNKLNKDTENGCEEPAESKSSSGSLKPTRLLARRGRTTERRKASTKRWVERKKALLAATGENVSDTDSAASDDAQLSPVQKARAKTNADKEAERQKRIAKTFKNLETNLTEKYMHDSDHVAIDDTDSDEHRTILRKESHSSTLQESIKDLLLNQTEQNDMKRSRSVSQEKLIGKDNSSPSLSGSNVTADQTNNIESQIGRNVFTPHSLKSELVIGNTTYIVTSTLILAEPQYLNKENLTNLTKDCKSLNIDENNQEKNTDIIDAVQLRRIQPAVSNLNSKKSVERCLNIEVEGTELEALKRVQIELAVFIEKEMKHKLFGIDDGAMKSNKAENVCTNSYQKLDQQLKTIVEKAIKKNIESSMRDVFEASKICDQKSVTVSPSFVKTAMNSPKYQPKVMVKRLNVDKENKLYNINNIHALKRVVPKTKLAGPFSAISRKRQSVLPIRYNDYNTSPLDSDSNLSSDVNTSEIPKIINVSTEHISRMHDNLGMKEFSGTNSQISNRLHNKRIENAMIKTSENNIVSVSAFSDENSISLIQHKQDYQDTIIKLEAAITENHICGVCGLSFNSRKDVEAHVRTHKVVNTENAPPRYNKHKMMRCKRCHEIVEARYVKAHVCKTVRQTHKCYVCNCIFRTEKLLVRHLETHDQSEFNIENIAKGETKKMSNADVLQNSKLTVSTKSEKYQSQKSETSIKIQNILTEKNDIQSDKITNANIKSDKDIVHKPKETYTCFVCDKIFTDEEILKDHLQKHCDDLSEGEQSTCKEQYQCAICGDTLDSDHALEEHVGKHLFDDEDDNPNLISISHDSEKMKDKMYHCEQCSETFESEMLLEMHMQAHEEEAAIAEWEKRTTKIYQYQCMLCDELFDTNEELAEHLDVHNANAQVCQLCDKPFRTLEDLQEHVATH